MIIKADSAPKTSLLIQTLEFIQCSHQGLQHPEVPSALVGEFPVELSSEWEKLQAPGYTHLPDRRMSVHGSVSAETEWLHEASVEPP